MKVVGKKKEKGSGGTKKKKWRTVGGKVRKDIFGSGIGEPPSLVGT
ncbi:hypothetical protein TNIN_220671, partial [Trichonephila inaurata madagascariensis]